MIVIIVYNLSLITITIAVAVTTIISYHYNNKGPTKFSLLKKSRQETLKKNFAGIVILPLVLFGTHTRWKRRRRPNVAPPAPPPRWTQE